MKKRKKLTKAQRDDRFSLTVTFSLIVFVILFISVGLSYFTVFFLSWIKVINFSLDDMPELRTIMILIPIVSIVLGFGVALLTLRYPLKPINYLINQINRLAAGDFSVRLKIGKPLSSHPAFAEACESFNKMAEELGGTEMLRRDFINNFSHEFKTPIVSIAGFAKLLKRVDLTEEQRIEYAAIIEEESLRLARMANNVLNLTRVENQTILTDLTAFNVSEQIRSSVLLLEDKWTKKNIDLSIEVGEVTLRANEELLKEVWINLIDNAVKFSPDGGTVSIKMAATDEGAEFEVSNEGPPISEENKKKIFNKFYQADESHSGEGNGVGLAIVKKIVDLHGGRVEVRCENELVIFSVTIPEKR